MLVLLSSTGGLPFEARSGGIVGLFTRTSTTSAPAAFLPPAVIRPERPNHVHHLRAELLRIMLPTRGVDVSRQNMIEIAKRGRIASRSAEAKAKQSAAQKQHHAARRAWLPSSLLGWLTQQYYLDKILPRLAGITVPQLAKTLCVSQPYASKVRKGFFVPHPMHWQALAELVQVVK